MGNFYDEIPPTLKDWIEKQKIFFVATAPLGAEGHVNVSPKGMEGMFFIENSNSVWYQDLTGSGIETVSHLNERGNGRMTIMFVAFEGGPRIVRLFGKGIAHERTTIGYKKFLPDGDARIQAGSRAVIELQIDKVGSSCGFSIPFFDYSKERPTLENWAKKRVQADLESELETCYPEYKSKGEYDTDEPISMNDATRTDILIHGVPADGGLREYWLKRNSVSTDGLPGLRILGDGKTLDPTKTERLGVDGQPKKGQVRHEAMLRGSGKALSVGQLRRSGVDLVMMVLMLLVGVLVGVRYGDLLRTFSERILL